MEDAPLSSFVALPDVDVFRPFAVVVIVLEEEDDFAVFLRIDCLLPIVQCVFLALLLSIVLVV